MFKKTPLTQLIKKNIKPFTISSNDSSSSTFDYSIRKFFLNKRLTDRSKALEYQKILNSILLNCQKNKSKFDSMQQSFWDRSKSAGFPYLSIIKYAFRKRADKLFTFIKMNAPLIDWDEPGGNIIINNKVLPGTNIGHLVRHLVTANHNIIPRDFDLFLSQLKSLHVPSNLIGNTLYSVKWTSY